MKDNHSQQKRGRGGIFFGVACFCLMGLTGCAKVEIKNIDSPGENIICFGNSLTYGYGVERGEDYPSVLSKMVLLPVINAGVNSNTSAQGLERLDKDVLSRNPALVVVELGCNDFLSGVPQEVTRKNILEIVTRIQAKKAMVAIVDVSSGFLFQEYQSLLRNIARDSGAIFIPNVFYHILTNPSLKSDFVHPNAQGYSLVAGRVYQGIIPHLNKRASLAK